MMHNKLFDIHFSNRFPILLCICLVVLLFFKIYGAFVKSNTNVLIIELINNSGDMSGLKYSSAFIETLSPNWSFIFFKQEKFQKALEYASLYPKLNPIGKIIRAQSYEALGLEDEALIEWTNAGAASYLANLAEVCLANGNEQCVLSRFTMASNLDPMNADILYRAGDAFGALGYVEEGFNFYSTAIAYDESDSIKKYFTSGRLHYVNHEWDLAIEDFNKANSIYEKDIPSINYWLGLTYLYGKKRPSKAIDYFEVCLSMETHRGCYLDLVYAYSANGESIKSHQLLNKSDDYSVPDEVLSEYISKIKEIESE